MASNQENRNATVKSENPILKYPSTLGQEKHRNIISFSAIKLGRDIQDRSQFFSAKPKYKYENAGGVYMYMPVIDPVKYDQSYTGNDKSMLQQLIGAVAGATGFSDGLEKVGGVLTAGIELGGAREEFTNDIENKHTYAKYEGPALRTISFKFDMVARNQEELKAIGDIEIFFKMNSATSYDVGQSRLTYPMQFVIEEISIGERTIPGLKFGPAYCTSVSVYSDVLGGILESGDSVTHSLELSFTETRILTQQDIELGL